MIDPTLLADAPSGFEVETGTDGAMTLRHRRTGMGCMNLFLVVWLSGWTVTCVRACVGFLSQGDSRPVDAFSIIGVWIPEIIVVPLTAFVLLSRRTYGLRNDMLTIGTEFLLYRRFTQVPRSGIRRLRQAADGGDDDSFPSWGLSLEADRKISLVYRQPYEVSHWLGKVIARWAAVEFVEVKPPKAIKRRESRDGRGKGAR